MHVLFRKTICTVISAVFGVTQAGAVFAQTANSARNVSTQSAGEDILNSVGKTGNNYGKTMAEQYKGQTPTWDGSSFSFSAGGKQYKINKDELAPNQDGSHIRYSTSESDIEGQKDRYDNPEAMDDEGNKSKDSLFAESKKDDPTIEGWVYKFMVDEAQTKREDLSKDASLKRSQDILDNLKKELENVISCKKSDNLATTGNYVHVPNIKECEQVLDRSDECIIDHNYSNGAIEFAGGTSPQVAACTDGTPNCTEVWLGKVGNNYYNGGSCRLFTEEIKIRVTNPNLITKAELWYAAYDDQMQVWIGPEGEETKIYQGPNSTFPYEDHSSNRTGVGCELGHHWIWDPMRKGQGCTESSCGYVQNGLAPIDLTAWFKGLEKNQIVRFYLRNAVGGAGEAFASMRVYYDPSKIQDEAEEWTNPACIQALRGLTDGVAKGEVTCTRMPEKIDAEGCALVGGAKVCRKYLQEPPQGINEAGIDKLCKQVKVKSNFTFYKGDMGCWEAMIGYDDTGKPMYETVCPGENTGGELDSCEKYVEQGCTFISSQCTEGMTGASGTCYVNDVKYDCGEDVKVGNDALTTEYNCEGIACTGDNCIDADRTTNSNFAKVSAILQVADYMAEDMDCTGTDDQGHVTGSDAVVCRIFKGSDHYCRKFVANIQDCCDDPKDGAEKFLNGLTNAVKHTVKASRDLVYQTETKTVETTTRDVSGQSSETQGKPEDVLANGVGYLNKAQTTEYENIQGNVEASKKEVKKRVAVTVKSILKSMGEYVMNITQDLAQMAGLGKEMLTGSNAYLTSAALVGGSVFHCVLPAMEAYVVAYLIIMYMLRCKDDELELMSKVSGKVCHYNGSWCAEKVLGVCVKKKKSYCCFSSPLSRIINEQVKKNQPELTGDWGSAKSPNCSGISVDAIEQIDWDKIDLSEWIGMMAISSNMVSSPSTASASARSTSGSSPARSRARVRARAAAYDPYSIENITGKGNYFANGMAGVERQNVQTRLDKQLQGSDVDQLRIQAARCFNMYLGNHVYVGGECHEVTQDSVSCRKNGHLVSCDQIAHDNMVDDLINNGGDSSKQDPEDDGYVCYRNGTPVECGSLWDEKQIEEVLKDYADIIGGTTYKDKYVCTDSSGAYTTEICEHAITKAHCGCTNLPGQFVCRKGSSIVDCATLPVDGDVKCPDECEKEHNDKEGYICEKEEDVPTDGAYCEEIDPDDTPDADPDVPTDGAYCEELDSGNTNPDIPDNGYTCVDTTPEDPDDPNADISDWIIDVEPTCTTVGSKHKENLKTGEVVKTAIITKVCTKDDEGGTDPNYKDTSPKTEDDASSGTK